MTKEDLGKCSHAIGVPGTSWEIGLVLQKNGAYRLAYDYYGSEGRPLQKVVGDEKNSPLLQCYAKNALARTLKAKGYGIINTGVRADGTIKMTVRSYAS